MSLTFCAWDHRGWAAYGLSDYGDFADMTTDCNVETYGDDPTRGEWFFIPEEPLTNEQGTFRAIYRGTWGNDNSPGADSYTHADLYDVNDPDDLAEFEADRAQWESAPEWLEPEQEGEEPDEGDIVTEDHVAWFMDGRRILTTADPNDPYSPAQDWRERLRAWMEAEGWFPSVFWLSDHGNAHPITDL